MVSSGQETWLLHWAVSVSAAWLLKAAVYYRRTTAIGKKVYL